MEQKILVRRFGAQNIKSFFKREDVRFKIGIASGIISVPVVVFVFVMYVFWILVKLNNIFFEAHGLIGQEEVRLAFSYHILNNLMPIFPYFVLGLLILFILGLVMGELLLRPFKELGHYCENALKDSKSVYNPDLFTSLQVLTRFSEYFFNYINNVRREGKLFKAEIPPFFGKIHTPVFEKMFFFHFSLLMFIVCIGATLMMSYLVVEMHDSLIQLALGILKTKGSAVGYYLHEQQEILYSVIIYTVGIIIVFYTIAALWLYSLVSGAAFAVFSTMRAFMKGQYSARVHLIGFKHIREYGRQINKYFDYLEDKYTH